MCSNTVADMRAFFVAELEPYQVYEITLSACTDVGCTNSTSAAGRTLQDKPEGTVLKL